MTAGNAGKVVAVIPSLSQERAANVVALAGVLEMSGVEVRVVANGRRLRDALANTGVAVLDPGENLGFAGAIEFAISEGRPWDRLLLVNDDIELDQAAALTLVRSARDAPDRSLTYFDPAAPIPIPAAGGVFLNLSLLGGASRRLARGSETADRDLTSGRAYVSFSLVSIGRDLWTETGGLDTDYPFTFEDADFVRRAAAAGAQLRRLSISGVKHLHSQTSRAHIEHILPASTWGAYIYLRKWCKGALGARALCVAALLIRLPMVFIVRAPVRSHVRGIGRAMGAVLRGRRPKLPEYADA